MLFVVWMVCLIGLSFAMCLAGLALDQILRLQQPLRRWLESMNLSLQRHRFTARLVR
jgi:hypothetical protein